MPDPIPFPASSATSDELSAATPWELLCSLKDNLDAWGKFADDKQPNEAVDRVFSRRAVSSLLWDVTPVLEELALRLEMGKGK